MRSVGLSIAIALLSISCTKKSELELQLSQEDTFWGLHTCGVGENKNECDSSKSCYGFKANGEIKEFYENRGKLEEWIYFKCGNGPEIPDPNWKFSDEDSILFIKSAEFKVYRYNVDTIFLKFVRHPEIRRALIRSKRKLVIDK